MMNRGALIAVLLAGVTGMGFMSLRQGQLEPVAMSAVSGNEAAAKARITRTQGQSFQIELPAAVAGNSSLGLVVSVIEFRPPRTGVASYMLRLRGGEPPRDVRLGGFGIFPNEAFIRTPETARQFVFGLTGPLTDLGIVRGPLEVLVSDETYKTANAVPDAEAGYLVLSSVKVETIKRDP